MELQSLQLNSAAVIPMFLFAINKNKRLLQNEVSNQVIFLAYYGISKAISGCSAMTCNF